MARQWTSNPDRTAVARLRGLAGEKSYRLEKGPIRDSWFLIEEVTGQLLAAGYRPALRPIRKALMRSPSGQPSTLVRLVESSTIGPI